MQTSAIKYENKINFTKWSSRMYHSNHDLIKVQSIKGLLLKCRKARKRYIIDYFILELILLYI